MKWIVCAVLACAACQQGEAEPSAPPPTAGAERPSFAPAPVAPGPAIPRAPVTPEYRQDITSLCDVVALSGADKMPENERWPIIAMWLGPHITTDDGRKFLVAIQPLKGEAKASALETEAGRVGLPGCALADEWRKPPPATP